MIMIFIDEWHADDADFTDLNGFFLAAFPLRLRVFA